MKRFLWSLAVSAAVLAAPSDVLAQEAAPEPAPAPAPAPADPNTGGLTLSGGVDYTTSYFFRGYNQEDTGLILQPYATVTASLVDRDDFDLNGYVGIWNSFHEKKTLADDTGPSTWYESDLFGGLDFVFGKFTLGTVYTFYTYPNGAFDTIQEIGVKLAYDDTEFMEGRGLDFALKPYVAAYFETADGNGTEDSYLELGIGPSFALGESGITLAVPVALGMSIEDYYFDEDGDDEFLGYGSVGLFASIPLASEGHYGTWTLTGGVQYIQLFADSAEAVNDGGEDNEILGKVGVSFAY
jgi:hypothetical protein